MFLPEIPETHKGHVLVARRDQVRIVESMTANQLDGSLKKIGKGLLSDMAFVLRRIAVLRQEMDDL